MAERDFSFAPFFTNLVQAKQSKRFAFVFFSSENSVSSVLSYKRRFQTGLPQAPRARLVRVVRARRSLGNVVEHRHRSNTATNIHLSFVVFFSLVEKLLLANGPHGPRRLQALSMAPPRRQGKQAGKRGTSETEAKKSEKKAIASRRGRRMSLFFLSSHQPPHPPPPTPTPPTSMIRSWSSSSWASSPSRSSPCSPPGDRG